MGFIESLLDFLRNECPNDNWTVVRPVISFSNRRLDIVLNSGQAPLLKAESGEELLLPESVRLYHAGIDWAGNSGKLIANLLFKPDAIRQIFTIYSGHNMTWEDVANAYRDEIGLRVKWVSDEEYLDSLPGIRSSYNSITMWYHDRIFDRHIDASKVLSVTGLKKDDFASVRDGILAELKILRPDRV